MNRAPFYVKAALAAALVAGLGATAALVAVKVYFPEPRARAYLIGAARRQLGRDVRLERIDVGLRGLSLHGLEVSERPDFAAGTFLRVENFRVRPSWRALLKRRLVVAAVAAEGFKVRVTQDAGGHFNYETLAASPAPAAAASPAAPSKGEEEPAAELDVRRALFSDGTVEYSDASGASWTLANADLEVANFGQDEPFSLTTSFQVRGRAGAQPVDAHLDFDGRVDLARGSREKFKAVVKRLVVEQQGLKLAASGTVDSLDAPELAYDATLSAGGLTLLQSDGSVKLGDAKSAEVKWKTPGLDTTLLAKLAPRAGIPALKIPTIEGTFSGVLKGGDLNIAALTAEGKEGSISAKGTVRGLGSAKPVPDVAAALALDLPAFKLSDLPFAVPGLSASFAVPAGRLDGTVRASGEDVRLEKVSFKSKGVAIAVGGIVARALAGAPSPDLAVAADLTLPALTDKDFPFSGATPGLRLPPSHWTADLSYSPRLLRVKDLRVVTGRNDVEASGTVADPSGRAAYDLTIKCRSFLLEEITQLTPGTRDMKLAGSGLFSFALTGTKDKPVYAGNAQFKDLGATAAGLALSDFTGTASFDANRVEVPNLTGKLAGGQLKMDLTVKNLSAAPDVQLEASLDRFDLGRYLAAKNKIIAERAAAKSAKAGSPDAAPSGAPAASGGAAAAPKEKSPLVSTRGHLRVGTLIHPNATVTDVRVGWNLRGVGADLHALNGDAQLHVGGGKISSAGDMAAQSKLVKILLFPLLIVQKLGTIGGIRLFPDFNNISLNQIVGDYLFQNGLMTLRQSEMDSDAAQVSAKGTIDLPTENLDLVITTQVSRVPPFDVAVTGPFDKPKTKLNLAKLLTTPAEDLIKGLLGR